MSACPPGLWMMIAGVLAVALPRGPRRLLLWTAPVLELAHIWILDPGTASALAVAGMHLEPLRVDALSRVFGTIFSIAALLSLIYGSYHDDRVEECSGTVYAGAAIAATFAGDLLTLFIWWEMTAVSSVLLVWRGGTPQAFAAGKRYLLIHVTSGVLLLWGAVEYWHLTGTLAFDHMQLQMGRAAWLIFLAFGIKACFPLLHNWLQDAYPRSTPAGSVWLSAFSTKLAVYALARGFAGTDLLIPIGATMTAFPIFFAVIENDLRKVLSYSLNNQLGFMLVGIGIGTELSLNGTAAHAFSHILYKGLLFMSMGAVLHRTGTVEASRLGGLYKSMPLTAMFCIVGSLSIAGFPLFSGFISKSMVIDAASNAGLLIPWMVLVFASAGVMDHSGIKVPFFAFFAHDQGHRVDEAPRPMLIAMGITAFLCLAIGVWPQALYAILPYPVEFHPYHLAHVIKQLELLTFSAIAFGWLYRRGHYPPEIPGVNLDFDWLYRVAIPGMLRPIRTDVAAAHRWIETRLRAASRTVWTSLANTFSPQAPFGGVISLEQGLIWICLTVAGVLLLAYSG
ncbi:MAG: Na(+)/H(+) antiporter subunit D [Candidatus Dadabacteria bacterium]|nr:MAG: Na(+)/H(+) antiporter subunit D [Candidatus Dadabacteria bacterium]